MNTTIVSPTRLLHLAGELKQLYAGQRLVEVALAHKREDLVARKFYLAPADGWPGKNEEQRRTAQEKAFAEDDVCASLGKLIRDNEARLAEFSAQVAALEAERRAIEWAVRIGIVEALTGQAIEAPAPVEETAFDETTAARLEQALFAPGAERLGRAEPQPAPYSADEDVPF